MSGTATILNGRKVGGSIVLDFKNDEMNFYGHSGDVKSNSMGIGFTYSFGIVRNYEKPEDYAGPFVGSSIGENLGNMSVTFDYCYNPEAENEKVATKAYTFSLGIGKGKSWPEILKRSYSVEEFKQPVRLLDL